jgi:hypothetical protein
MSFWLTGGTGFRAGIVTWDSADELLTLHELDKSVPLFATRVAFPSMADSEKIILKDVCATALEDLDVACLAVSPRSRSGTIALGRIHERKFLPCLSKIESHHVRTGIDLPRTAECPIRLKSSDGPFIATSATASGVLWIGTFEGKERLCVQVRQGQLAAFQAPVEVACSSSGEMFLPCLACDELGTVHVSWLTYLPEGEFDVMYAAYDATGACLRAPRKVCDAPFSIRTWPGWIRSMTCDAGRPVIQWVGERGGKAGLWSVTGTRSK